MPANVVGSPSTPRWATTPLRQIGQYVTTTGRPNVSLTASWTDRTRSGSARGRSLSRSPTTVWSGSNLPAGPVAGVYAPGISWAVQSGANTGSTNASIPRLAVTDSAQTVAGTPCAARLVGSGVAVASSGSSPRPMATRPRRRRNSRSLRQRVRRGDGDGSLNEPRSCVVAAGVRRLNESDAEPDA